MSLFASGLFADGFFADGFFADLESALIVQSDAGDVSNANAYISVDYADQYFSKINKTLWSSLTTSQKDAAILIATNYIDLKYGIKIKGVPLNMPQPTEFPRSGLYDRYGNEISGIPYEIETACAEYAFIQATSDDGLMPLHEYDATGLPVKSTTFKAGPVTDTVVYQDGQYSPLPFRKFTYPDMLVEKFTNRSNVLLRV